MEFFDVSVFNPNDKRYVNQDISKTYELNASVIRQKGESQNECFKKTKHTKFSEKRTFFTP